MQVLNIIRRCIIATDLVQFFKNKAEFKQMVDNNEQPFNWEDEKCRGATMALAMTSCDLTSGEDKQNYISNGIVYNLCHIIRGAGRKMCGTLPQPTPMGSKGHMRSC